MATLDEKAPRRRHFAGLPIHPATWCVLMAILFVVQTADAQNDQQQTSPNVKAQQRGGEEIPVTSFSCKGRVPGYYADLETGCQVYHMCAAGSQKFSYRCPQQTLFQQRMMVCDHWFMVDCKTSQLYYAANERIGKINQPFISSGEKISRDFVPDSFYPVKLESRTQSRAIEAPLNLNSIPANIPKPDLNLLPPFNPEIQKRAGDSFPEGSTLPSIINRALAPVSNAPQPSTRAPFNTPSTPQKTFPRYPSPPNPRFEIRSTLAPPQFNFRSTPAFASFLQQDRTTVRPMGLSENTLSVIKSSFFGNFPQVVSQSTQSFAPTTTPRPLTTLLDDVLSPSTINSLLNKNPREKKNRVPIQLRVMLDTRRMFYIPDSKEDLERIPSNQQSLEFDFPELPPVKPMRFKDHFHVLDGGGNEDQCPPQCLPAFMKPGTCEPCVIVR